MQAKRADLNIEINRFKQQENRIQQRESAAKAKEKATDWRISRAIGGGGVGVDEAREQMMEHLAGEVRARSAALAAMREPSQRRVRT